MKTGWIVLTTLFCCFNAQAYSNFIGNPYTPYPPGCATIPDLQAAIYGDNAVKFFEGQIPLPNALNLAEYVDADVAAYRVACAEPNRSVILLEFSIPEELGYTWYQTPAVRAVVGEISYGVSLAREVNGWNVGIEPSLYGQNFGGPYDWEDPHARTWIFVLDNTTPFDLFFDFTMSPTQYNGSFRLEFEGQDDSTNFVIDVPSTASLLSASARLPLSGRLSGNWVVEGALDQGFVISVSELVPNTLPVPEALVDTPLLMFLSWYTYDNDGDMLWLTGAAQFEMGATVVTVPIEKVTNGEFLGDKTANREVVGSVTLTGNSCDDLSLQYDLDNLGLGSGTERLKRLFSLETAGYVCRDLQARILAK